MDLAKSGADALSASDPATAATQYTKALLVHPASPDYLTQRATAFARLKPPRYDLALRDAELAVLCGRKRSSRKHIQAAQLRRVVGLYHNGRHAEAKYVLGTMQRWLPNEEDGEEKLKAAMSGADKTISMEAKIWLNKVNKRLAEHPQPEFTSGDEYPEGTDKDIADATLLKLYKSQLKADGTFNFDWQPGQESTTASTPQHASSGPSTGTTTTTTTTTTAPSAPVTTKVRHEWYQNAQSVIITLYAKGVPKDKAQVDIQDDSLSISFPQPSDPTASFSFTLDPLHALIDTSNSTAKIMSTKVEITLKKAAPGVKWPALEGTEPLQKHSTSSASDRVAKAAIMSSFQSGQPPATPTASAPVYPTSSKSGPKNWDKLAKDLTKKKAETKKKKNGGNDDDDAISSDGAENDDNDDDDDDDEYGGDAVDGFFKKLYKGADPDTRRAMMKSYQESNGTALSTNWAEVGSKHYDPVEEKKDD
ncbi:hypothetical protein DV736_g5512, partial [Chaetothyriales sp. CBS 134916]